MTSLLLVCSTEALKIQPHHTDPLKLVMPNSICGVLNKPIHYIATDYMNHWHLTGYQCHDFLFQNSASQVPL